MEYINTREFARLSTSNMEMSDHIVVLTAIVGAMVTRASVDYERLEECVNFAAKRYRAGKRSAFLEKASSVLHDLEAMQKALGVENRKPMRELRDDVVNWWCCEAKLAAAIPNAGAHVIGSALTSKDLPAVEAAIDEFAIQKLKMTPIQ